MISFEDCATRPINDFPTLHDEKDFYVYAPMFATFRHVCGFELNSYGHSDIFWADRVPEPDEVCVCERENAIVFADSRYGRVYSNCFDGVSSDIEPYSDSWTVHDFFDDCKLHAIASQCVREHELSDHDFVDITIGDKSFSVPEIAAAKYALAGLAKKCAYDNAIATVERAKAAGLSGITLIDIADKKYDDAIMSSVNTIYDNVSDVSDLICACDNDAFSDANQDLSRLVKRGLIPMFDELEGVYGHERMDSARLESLQCKVMCADCELRGVVVRPYKDVHAPDLDL